MPVEMCGMVVRMSGVDGMWPCISLTPASDRSRSHAFSGERSGINDQVFRLCSDNQGTV